MSIEVICTNCNMKYHEDIKICEKCGCGCNIIPPTITKLDSIVEKVSYDPDILLQEILKEKKLKREVKEAKLNLKKQSKEFKKIDKVKRKKAKKQFKQRKRNKKVEDKRKRKLDKKNAKFWKKREKQKRKEVKKLSKRPELPSQNKKYDTLRMRDIENLTTYDYIENQKYPMPILKDIKQLAELTESGEVLERGCTGRVEVAMCNGSDLYLGGLITRMADLADIDLAAEDEIVDGVIISQAHPFLKDLSKDYWNPFPDNQWVNIYCDPIGNGWCFIGDKYRLVNLSLVIGKRLSEVLEIFNMRDMDHLTLSLNSEGDRCGTRRVILS